MKLRVAVLVSLAVCICLFIPIQTLAQVPTISTNAEAAALIDVSSGRILYSSNGDKQLRIASLTKIMTAIVAIESSNLSDKVKVGLRSYGVEGSSIYLHLGEEMNLHHMLYGLMLRSGNDAATAIAEHVGGSLEGFVVMMNDKAEQIGMTNSHFMNPHGLDIKGHYSSANDMALLAAYALHNPVFRNIVKTESISVPNPYEKWDYRWRNKNKMLHLYEGADGVKTGFTKLSNRTLVSSATRNGQQLAVVTLNDGSDWADHSKLLDYGFKHYPLQVIQQSGQSLSGTELVSPHSFTYPLSEDENIRVQVKSADEKSLSFRLGVRATAYYYLDNRLIGKQPFYNKNDPIMKTESSRITWQHYRNSDVIIRDNAISIMGRLFKALFTTSY